MFSTTNAQTELNLRWAQMFDGTFLTLRFRSTLSEGTFSRVPNLPSDKISADIYNNFRYIYKHAYSNILKFLPPKYENFQMKNSDNFHISAQNIDCGDSLELPRRGGSNESPQSMFLSRNKKNNVYPCKPQFYYIKEGFKGVKII